MPHGNRRTVFRKPEESPKIHHRTDSSGWKLGSDWLSLATGSNLFNETIKRVSGGKKFHARLKRGGTRLIRNECILVTEKVLERHKYMRRDARMTSVKQELPSGNAESEAMNSNAIW